MTAPLVSILTPSFNQARWLGDNLRSVANQTYERIEHIVMDGGSTDGSVELLQPAPERVRWRSETDRGQSHALNKAFAESQGEIIGWLNSDDAYFSTRAVEAAVDLFTRRPEVDVVYGHAALVNADGLILQMIWTPQFSYGLLRLHNFIIQPSAFIRRSALTDTIADEAYDSAMDRELWLRLGRDLTFARINQVVAIDRHQLERKTLTQPELGRADTIRLISAYGVPSGWWTQPARKALKIIFRLRGAALLRHASGPLAFDGRYDGSRRLALRQLALPRSAMPAGSHTARMEGTPL